MESETTNLEPCLEDSFTTNEKCLTAKEKEQLKAQDKRLISEFKANQLEQQAQKYWDIFYKRNETKFFKDRRWTTREFEELLGNNENVTTTKTLLEIGCGVGNFVYPLLEDEMKRERPHYFYYACDFSPRAIDFVKSHALYNERFIKAFQCDVTKNDQLAANLRNDSLDVVTMIFVLSAINPEKFKVVLTNLWHVLKHDGIILFRDYGLYDMAQIRFKPGHKIAENFYMRQDGTRSYYFAEHELAEMFKECGFDVITCTYVHRRTKNLKEGIDVPRIFLQGKFRKCAKS